MARIRTVKPEFWEDEKVAELSFPARLAYIGTWNLADDEGILRWTADYLNAALFMYDGFSVKKAQAIADELVALGLVFPYRTGRMDLAYIPRFRKHQRINRPQPGKFPPPPITNEKVARMYAERDGWICHLCSGPINPEREFVVDPYGEDPRNGRPDLNLSLDHLEPRSQGGGDNPSNLAAAHVACNKGRRDRPVSDFHVPASVTRALGHSLNESVNGSPLEGNGREGKGSGKEGEEEGTGKEEEDLDLPQAAEVEDNGSGSDPLVGGDWLPTPRGWTDLEASLYRKLFTRDSAWSDLTFAALNKLNREFTKPVVEQALQHAWEETAMGELAVEAGPFPLLRAVCERIAVALSAGAAGAEPVGGYLDG